VVRRSGEGSRVDRDELVEDQVDRVGVDPLDTDAVAALVA